MSFVGDVGPVKSRVGRLTNIHFDATEADIVELLRPYTIVDQILLSRTRSLPATSLLSARSRVASGSFGLLHQAPMNVSHVSCLPFTHVLTSLSQ
jgi:hypothetical protein